MLSAAAGDASSFSQLIEPLLDPDLGHIESVRIGTKSLGYWPQRFASDPEVSEVLIKCAREKDTRRCLQLLGAILETPGLSDRLLEALRPELAANGNRRRTAVEEGRRIR